MGEASDIGDAILADGQSEAERLKTDASFPSFDISGRRYIAVPARYCRDSENGRVNSEQTAVGRITLGGELHFLFGRAKSNDDIATAEVLTHRELQVAMLVADGKCDKQIARLLGISCYTVREHLRRTFSKLHIANRSALVALVVRQEHSLRGR